MKRLKSMFHTSGYFLEKTYAQKKRFCLIFSLAGKNVNQSNICDALCDLVPFVQFKKREKHPREVILLVKLQAEACD